MSRRWRHAGPGFNGKPLCRRRRAAAGEIQPDRMPQGLRIPPPSKKAHEKAIDILKENTDKLHELARYLLEKETITGEEFMEILNRPS